MAGSEEESYSYRPFVLKQENFKLSEAEAAEMRKKSGTGDVGVTPIVGLDTVTMQDTEAVADRARRAAGEAARRKLERPADVVGYETAKSLPEIIHGCWFLLYRSYVRRKSEKAAQGAIAEAKAVQAEKVTDLQRSLAPWNPGGSSYLEYEAVKAELASLQQQQARGFQTTQHTSPRGLVMRTGWLTR